MQAIAYVLIIFGTVGLLISIFLLLKVKSPILKTQSDEEIIITGLSLQTILNLVFGYFMILHLMFVLIGANFLVG